MSTGAFPDRSADPVAQGREERVVGCGSDRCPTVVALVRHHQGSREAITEGRGPNAVPAPCPPPGVLVGPVVHKGGAQGEPVSVGVVGEVGALVVGAEVVGALLVGALDVGADDVRCVDGGGGGGVYGAWPVSGGVPVTYAGGGKLCTWRPTRSRFITAAHVAVG
jgi:hypothetical protein